jgi:predicted GNAT family N-acyltransferase
MQLYFRSMMEIRLMSWSEAKIEASRIRFAVFVEEQGVPREIELDEHDEPSLHALASVDDGTVVGTGRLLADGHIGRMAVSRESRGSGVGGAILEALVEAARRRGDREVVLSAQTHALGFYRRHGFVEQDGVYEEAGIPHQSMRRAL